MFPSSTYSGMPTAVPSTARNAATIATSSAVPLTAPIPAAERSGGSSGPGGPDAAGGDASGLTVSATGGDSPAGADPAAA